MKNKQEKYCGFVINKTIYKDFDQIITILTSENQKISFKARSILKPNNKNAMSCNEFIISEFILNQQVNSDYKSLKSSSIIKMYHRPFDDLLTASIFSLIVDIIFQIANEISIFVETIYCFDELEKGTNPLDVCNFFFKTICKKLRYQTFINGCVDCHKKNNLITFDFKMGGYLCQNCYSKYYLKKLPVNYLKQLHELFKNNNLIILEEENKKRLFFQYLHFINDEIGLYLDKHYNFFKTIIK